MSHVRPRTRQPLTLRVLRKDLISPGFISLTLAGSDLSRFNASGPDQAVRLFFPREGQNALIMPTVANQAWTVQMLAQPVSRRPWVRIYTVRAFRAGAFELDVEVAVHGDSPASSWARRAQPGSPVGLLDEGYSYRHNPEGDWEILVGDESALPAIAAILERAPQDYRAHVFLEIADKADIRILTAPSEVSVHWLPRIEPDLTPGQVALRALEESTLPAGRVSAWLAGEHKLPTGARRLLVGRGVSKRDITFTGYWRKGLASLG